jgi:hypothetical protein
MKDKGHFITSLIKSVFRICGCVFSAITNTIYPLITLFIIAELFGILEEIFDRR